MTAPHERAESLVLAAADAMDDGRDPFDHHFLAEHDVTLSEAHDLSEALALGARLYTCAMRNISLGGSYAQKAAFDLSAAMMTVNES